MMVAVEGTITDAEVFPGALTVTDGKMEFNWLVARDAARMLEAKVASAGGIDWIMVVTKSLGVISTPTAASSSRLVLNPSSHIRTSPSAAHLDLMKSARRSVCANSPFCVYSLTISAHMADTFCRCCVRRTVESGMRWVSRFEAKSSSFIQSSIAVCSEAVGDPETIGSGQALDPSKWLQTRFDASARFRRR